MSSTKPSPRKLRIAVLNRHFGKRFGGAEHYSAALVEQLASRYEIHVFAQEIEHQIPGVHDHKISRPCTKPRWLNQIWYSTTTWWLTRRGFDLVHSHENTWHGDIQTIHVRPFRTGLFHGRMGLRRWIRWLSLWTSPRLMSYWYLESLRMQPREGRSIVATSEMVKQEILQAYPHVSPILHTVAPGVNLPPDLQDRQDKQAKMRASLNLPQNVMLALFVGNDYIKKGLPTLLRALAQLPGIHLAVAGKPTHQSDCQQLAQSLGLNSRVHFLGSLPSVASAYEAADLLVHPTLEDTYAMVVLEAMAYGLPVIVSGPKYCGISATLVDGREALLLENPLDPEELAKKIEQIAGMMATQRPLNIAGRNFARHNDWQAVARSYETLYAKAAAKKFSD